MYLWVDGVTGTLSERRRFEEKAGNIAAHRGGKWDELFSDGAGAAANKGPSKVPSDEVL